MTQAGAASVPVGEALPAELLAALFGGMARALLWCRMEYAGAAPADITVRYANPAFLTLFRQPDGPRLCIRALLDAGSAPDEDLLPLLERMLRLGEATCFERQLPALNQWLQIDAWRTGPAHFALGFADVADKRRAEAERYAQRILDAVGDGICQVDASGSITYINPRGAAMLGYSPAEMTGRHAHRLFHHSHADGSHYPAAQCAGHQAMQLGRPLSVDNEVFWRKDGSSFAVQYTVAPMRVEGVVQAEVLSFRDTSEEQRIRRALLDKKIELHQSHDLLQKLSTEIPGALYQFLMQPDGRFSVPYASKGAKDLFGFDPELVREDAGLVFEAIVPEARAAFIASIRHSARTLQTWVEEFEVELPGQGRRWRQGQGRPELLEDGSVVWHGFVSDSTDRVESRRQLQRLNETLESRVLERTRELAAALDSAELAMRSRGQFLANVSHEIRTPMNAIMGMVYLLLRSKPDPQQRGYLEKVRQSGAHLLNIINDILDFSKIDAGKLQLDPQPCDLLQLLQQVVQMSEGKASEKGLGLTLEVAPGVPRFIRCDALRLGQILINFLNNASKFTERGHIHLRAYVRPDAAPGQTTPDQTTPDFPLVFEVEDSGIGMDSGQLTRLFHSFEQGDNSTTRKFGGTGLGLAISRQLAWLMGGEVGARSTPGVGSSFWFACRFALAPPPHKASTPERAPPDSRAALRGKCVLVVDDNEFNLDVACELLSDIGMQVQTAVNGQQALDMLRGQRFDAVLMDVQMPVMDGLEATRHIRAGAAPDAGMVVIAVTANAGAEDRARCLQAGMDEVLTKPVDPELLFLSLAQRIGAQRQAGAAPRPVPALPASAPAGGLVLTDLPVWEAAALERAVGDKPATQQRLLDKYLQSAEGIVAALGDAAGALQWPAMADLAHKLKSSSRAVGALRLGGLCEALERAGRAGDASQCQALWAAVEPGLADVRDCIRARPAPGLTA